MGMNQDEERNEAFRPPSLDKEGHRNFIYQADFDGYYNKLKKKVHPILIILFLAMPWISWHGEQLVLLDIPHRRFNFFGFQFWSHDGPLIFFFIFGGALLLAFVTAVWGRVWCGWACPQTVFLDGVYRKIERWIEGKPRARKRLHDAPWTFDKIRKRLLKWFLYLVVTLIITHSFLAYFVGSSNIWDMVTTSPTAHPTSFTFMLVSSFLIFVNFAWFREQTCLIVCPYGRFQSVLMDQNSMAVAYNAKRGEPRREKWLDKSEQGDCVNCGRCVDVCPTGIDIRKGLQMECIACTACIDACDSVMERFKKPKGLISYTTLEELDNNRPPKKINPRTISYLVLMAIVAVGLGMTLSAKKKVKIDMIRAISTPYQVVNAPNLGKVVVNHYQMKVHNKFHEDLQIKVVVPEDQSARGVQVVIATGNVTAKKSVSTRADVFIKFPVSMLKLGLAKTHLDYKVMGHDDLELEGSDIPLVGPFKE